MAANEPNPVIYQALVAYAESMEPFIEFAEGQKAMMIERGWSAETADVYARELLVNCMRTVASR